MGIERRGEHVKTGLVLLAFPSTTALVVEGPSGYGYCGWLT